MRNPTVMLLWEQFRQTWAFFIIGALVIWSFGVLESQNAIFREFEATIPLAVTLITLCCMFLQGTPSNLRLIPPPRMYSLPISTGALFTALSAYRVTIMMLFSLILGWVQDRYLPKADLPPSWAYPIAMLPLTLWMQTLVNLMGAYGIYRGLAHWVLQAIPAMLGTVISVALLLSSRTPASVGVAMLLYGIITVLGASTGYIALRNARHAASRRGVDIAAYTKFLRQCEIVSSVTACWRRLIPSAFRAQFCLEWRAYMVWLPRITAMVLGILLVLKVILLVLYRFEGWRLHNYLEFENAALMFLPGSIAFGVGFYALRSPNNYLAFCCTRPLSLKTQIRAKLAAGALAIATAMLLVGAACCINVLIERARMPRIQVEMIVIAAATFIFAAWVMLFTGRLLVLAWLASFPVIVLTPNPEILIQEFGHAVSVYFSVILGAGAALAWAALRQRCGEPWFPRREWGRMLYACAAATLISAGAIFGPKIDPVVVFVYGGYGIGLIALYGRAWRHGVLSTLVLTVIVGLHLSVLIVAWNFDFRIPGGGVLVIGLILSCMAFAWVPLALQRRRVR